MFDSGDLQNVTELLKSLLVGKTKPNKNPCLERHIRLLQSSTQLFSRHKFQELLYELLFTYLFK